MESNLRPSAFVSSRISSIDVSQLDKVNAIPNKASNNALIDGLCMEDKLYLESLMDEDSSESDDNDDTPNLGGSPWSPPMAERPMVMGPSKRMKRMKSSYTITMSLEDISYIRPSWGMSTKGGIKRINKKTGSSKKSTGSQAETTSAAGKDKAGLKIDELDGADKAIKINPYHMFLVLIILTLAILMTLSYIVELSRNKSRAYQYRIELHPAKREFNVFKQKDSALSPKRGLRVNYGRGIPGNLKHEECACEMYDTETRKYYKNMPREVNENCFACFDWAQRANMQMFINRSQYRDLLNYQQSSMIEEDPAITCYDIKWQSYDTLTTPIVDCFRIGDEQWFGLGDIQTPLWPLNKFDQADFAPLITNLSAEFNTHHQNLWGLSSKQEQEQEQQQQQQQQHPLPAEQRVLNFGSHVDLSLVTSNGFFIGNLKTDLQASIRISARAREICVSASCLDKCTQLWSRHDEQSDRLRYENNRLEYSICSASSWRLLSLRLVDERIKALGPAFIRESPIVSSPNSIASPSTSANKSEGGSGSLIIHSDQTREKSRTRAQVPADPPSRHQQMAPVGEIESSPASQLITSDNNIKNTQLLSSATSSGAASSASSSASSNQLSPNEKRRQQPEGIGLIERTIFKTSPEYIENLDGQTVRQYVDKIVKLNLKTSPILLLDTRWQNFVGSFKLNSALFPKAKLLFEILHNKGFKIVVTIKPYIDINIGISNLNQLLEHNRLATVQYESDLPMPAVTSHSNILSLPPQIRAHLSQQPKLAPPPSATHSAPLVASSASGSGSGSDAAASQQEASGSSSSSSSSRDTSSGVGNFTTTVVRRSSFFVARNETVYFKDRLEQQMATKRKPYLFECRESYHGHCVPIDLVPAENRAWMVELIKRSTFLSQEADAILLAGAHPDSLQWQNHYRRAMFQLIDQLYLDEHLYVIPQWSGNFNYIQLAPRQRNWTALRSVVDSVLHLGMQGVSLIHPGSVWGDIKPASRSNRRQPEPASLDKPVQAPPMAGMSAAAAPAATTTTATSTAAVQAAMPVEDVNGQAALSEEQREEELIVRWLQVAVFLPILQFNDLSPIDKYNLHEQVQNLVKVRKMFVVPEIKKHLPFTPLINCNFDEFKRSRPAHQQQLAALRYTWYNVLIGADSSADSSSGGGGGGGGASSGSSSSGGAWQANEVVGQQFMIGSDMLVAPVLQENQRQKDIYLPAGIWRDELRQTNVRGGKWLRNYPVELNEIAWFTRARR